MARPATGTITRRCSSTRRTAAASSPETSIISMRRCSTSNGSRSTTPLSTVTSSLRSSSWDALATLPSDLVERVQVLPQQRRPNWRSPSRCAGCRRSAADRRRPPRGWPVAAARRWRRCSRRPRRDWRGGRRRRLPAPFVGTERPRRDPDQFGGAGTRQPRLLSGVADRLALGLRIGQGHHRGHLASMKLEAAGRHDENRSVADSRNSN